MHTVRISVALAVSLCAMSWTALSRADDKGMNKPPDEATTSPGVAPPTTPQPAQPPASTTTTTGVETTTGTTSTTGTMTGTTGTTPYTSPYATTPVATTTTTASPYRDPYAYDRPETATLRPNRTLLLTGTGLLVGSYGASVIVAAASDTEADNRLYIPVVGPWLDMAERECGFGDCGAKSDWQNVLLLGSGIAQGAGLGIAIASAFIPETRTVFGSPNVGKSSSPAKGHVSVLPISMRAGVGVGAMGSF